MKLFDYLKILQGLLLFFCLLSKKGYTQRKETDTKEIIASQEEIAKIFTGDIKKKHGIYFPILHIYKYKDPTGMHYLVLTEHVEKIEQDTLYNAIKAFDFSLKDNTLMKEWELSDQRRKGKTGEEAENSIWFWTKYCSIKDIDGDGKVDPVIVYGTFGGDGYDDGRLHICIYYKGQKRMIRHQNSPYDDMRNTRVEKTFYTLPQKIQRYIQALMKNMENDNHAIFPYGYEKDMQHKVLFMREGN